MKKVSLPQKVLSCLIKISILLLLIIAFSAGCLQTARWRIRNDLHTPQRFGKARLEVVEQVPILHLYGSRKEMGHQHGTILAEALSGLDFYVRWVTRLKPGMRKRIFEQAKRLERALPESIREELQAMASAAGIDYETLVALNVTPRIYCSALAVWKGVSSNKEVIFGRNAEYLNFGLGDRGSYLVIYHPDDGIPVLSVNFIGLIGSFTGINERGVAFGNMLVFNGDSGLVREDGVVISLLMREAAMQSDSARTMASLLNDKIHATWVNVMIADRMEAISLELGTERHIEHKAEAQTGVLAATNYFRSPEMYSREVSCPRYQALHDIAVKNLGRFDSTTMKEALRVAQIPSINIQSAVFEPSAQKLHISINRIPAADGPFVEFDLMRLFGD